MGENGAVSSQAAVQWQADKTQAEEQLAGRNIAPQQGVGRRLRVGKESMLRRSKTDGFFLSDAHLHYYPCREAVRRKEEYRTHCREVRGIFLLRPERHAEHVPDSNERRLLLRRHNGRVRPSIRGERRARLDVAGRRRGCGCEQLCTIGYARGEFPEPRKGPKRAREREPRQQLAAAIPAVGVAAGGGGGGGGMPRCPRAPLAVTVAVCLGRWRALSQREPRGSTVRIERQWRESDFDCASVVDDASRILSRYTQISRSE